MEENKTMVSPYEIVDETKFILNKGVELLEKYNELSDETKEKFNTLDEKIFNTKSKLINETVKEVSEFMKPEKYLAQINTDIKVTNTPTQIKRSEVKMKPLSLYFGKFRSLIDAFMYSLLLIFGFIALSAFTQKISFIGVSLEEFIFNIKPTLSFYSLGLVPEEQSVLTGIIALILVFLFSLISFYKIGIFTRKINNSRKAKKFRKKVDEFLNARNEEVLNIKETYDCLKEEYDLMERLRLILNEKLNSIKRIKELEKLDKLSGSHNENSKKIINDFNRIIEIFNNLNFNQKVFNSDKTVNIDYKADLIETKNKIGMWL